MRRKSVIFRCFYTVRKFGWRTTLYIWEYMVNSLLYATYCSVVQFIKHYLQRVCHGVVVGYVSNNCARLPHWWGFSTLCVGRARKCEHTQRTPQQHLLRTQQQQRTQQIGHFDFHLVLKCKQHAATFYTLCSLCSTIFYFLVVELLGVVGLYCWIHEKWQSFGWKFMIFNNCHFIPSDYMRALGYDE